MSTAPPWLCWRAPAGTAHFCLAGIVGLRTAGNMPPPAAPWCKGHGLLFSLHGACRGVGIARSRQYGGGVC
eukprot:4472307-Pyramimonas_sp.AAC.1